MMKAEFAFVAYCDDPEEMTEDNINNAILDLKGQYDIPPLGVYMAFGHDTFKFVIPEDLYKRGVEIGMLTGLAVKREEHGENI